MDNEQLKRLYEQSTEAKKTSWELYEQAMKYAIPNESANPDDVSIQKPEGIYDSMAMIENSKLARKQVNMILPTNIQWGSLKTDIKKGTSKSEEDSLAEYGNTVYKVLVNSNLNKEAMGFFLNLGIGTGCMKMIYTGDETKPIQFTNIPLRNIYFLEGGAGQPKYVFHETKDLRLDQIIDLFPEGNVGGMDEETNYDIIESVFPSETEGKWSYRVTTNGFEDIIFEAELVYNPFVVCRTMKTAGGVWGAGVVINVLPNIVNLNDSKYLKRVCGKLGIKPPLAFQGDAKQMSKVSMGLGEMFYLGQRGQNSIDPVNLTGNFNVELMNINDDKDQIREGMFSSYISQQMNEGQPRTAFEWQKRNSEFLEVFSSHYNMIQEEFLIPVFMNTLAILAEIGYNEIDAGVINNSEAKPVFYNKLTENYKTESIENMNNYIMNLVNVLGSPEAVLGVINLKELAIKFADWYDIDRETLKEEGEIEEFMQQYLEKVMSGGQQQ